MIFLKYSLASLISVFRKISSAKYPGLFIPILHDVKPSQFRILKDLLKELQNSHIFINPSDLHSIESNSRNWSRHRLMLTFDDGFYSNFLVAKEVLDPLNIKAIFFISTDFIDSADKNNYQKFIKNNLYNGFIPKDLNLDEAIPMNWDNINSLNCKGHMIGSHTKKHLKLSEVKDDKILHQEIIESGDYIEKKIGAEVQQFAFPFGDIKSINKRSLEIAGSRYKYIFSGIRGSNSYKTNFKVIRRDNVNLDDTILYNRFICDGGWSFLYSKKRKKLDRMVL